MKKNVSILLVLVLLLATCSFTGCKKADNDTTIVVGASPSPHAEILEAAKPLLEKEGYTLEIKEFTDYVLPNTALDTGDIDANYFQHQPYLTDFNAKNGTDLVSVAAIHFEPLGLYAGKTASLDQIKDGAEIAVPNDSTNEARALLLLEANGLIKLKDGAGLDATALDIVENPHKIKIKELAAELIPRALADVDFAVINGNYVLSSDITAQPLVAEDITKGEIKDFAKTYVNIIAVKAGNENLPKIKALVKVMTSGEIKQFIEEKYGKQVVAVF